MSKKISFSLVLGIVLTALFTVPVFAGEGDSGQPDRPFPRIRRIGVRGEIAEVNNPPGTFTLHTWRGEDLSFFTDERTKFRGMLDGLEDLTLGMPTAVLAVRQDGGLLALQVVAHEKLDRVRRYGGEVIALDSAGGSLTVKTPASGELVFLVDENTRYHGALEGFDDLETGQAVIIAGATLDDAALRAIVIHAPLRLPIRRAVGEVTAVDPDAGLMTILNRQGESLVIGTDESTAYHSRDGAIDELSDLQAGMKVLVIIEIQPERDLLAKRVLVHIPG